MSAAQISAAISAAIVAGEYQSSVFSQRSCEVGPCARMQAAARSTWRQVSGSLRPSCEASRIGSATSSSCRPVQYGHAVDARVLREASVGGLLVRPQVVERAARRRAVAGRDLRSGHLVEVARPHEVVGPGVVECAPDPRHRRRRDARAAVGLVLEAGQHHRRDVVEPLVTGGAVWPREPAEVGVPARGVAAGSRAEAPAERRARGAGGRARGGAEPERERGAPMARPPRHRQLGDLGDVALGRGAVVGPVHPEVVAEVRPAVALAQVAARHARRGGLARAAPRRACRRARPARARASRRRRRCRCWRAPGRAARRACTGAR